ncbi:hypothetical protein [Pseudomonas taiwanensis]|uniref:hypothetical protein n=1 Tax=Pseudomonas taiwanensis TaxID=470150 RepID=UPI000428A40F|nr:hypothetical protein [Pseudomonas taiwanensis]
MSGSNTRFYGRSSAANPACETLELYTQLSSPKEEVVDQIEVGDVLEVVVNTLNSFSTVQVLWRGRLAGGIASPDIQLLQRCLSEGVIYLAEVKEKSGGEIRVRIYPYTA